MPAFPRVRGKPAHVSSQGKEAVFATHDIYKVVIGTGQIYIATGQMYIATRHMYIATGQIYIATRQIYIVTGQIYIATGQIYDLMSDKYITSLLLIKKC